MLVTYDTEIFPNCFLLCATDGNSKWGFEISAFRNDLAPLCDWLLKLAIDGDEMVGFNNVGFDYPLLHYVVTTRCDNPLYIYKRAQAILHSEDKFAHLIRPSDRRVRQIDLFRIHHFDNKARTTSLKNLEFSMQMGNISDLPFPVGKVLTRSEVETLRDYCWNDVEATQLFLQQSEEKIAFRRSLSKTYNYDFMNFSDVKIGKEIFQNSLEKAGVPLWEYDDRGRKPRQTQRHSINLADCIPPFIEFDDYGLQTVHNFFRLTTITQTKAAFDLQARVGGLDFYFGTGGIHASVETQSFVADDDMMIYDIDVTGMYPAIAMSQGYYPEHLGPRFLGVYKELGNQRALHAKGTPANAAYKLAMNGVYGASNDQFSVFYDPLFTMKITVGGQLMLAMLAEWLLRVPGLQIIQANTDGITMYAPRRLKNRIGAICGTWEQMTGLNLEHVEYSKMFVRDVNNYVAQKVDGSVKRKGAFEYDVDWHQDASALVVQKVAEKVLIEGAPIRATVESWPNLFDFMLRARVTSNSALYLLKHGKKIPLDRTQRYYISKSGGELFKAMPPLAKKPDEWRHFAIQKGWRVHPCNNLGEALEPIDFDWYVEQVEKLVYGVM